MEQAHDTEFFSGATAAKAAGVGVNLLHQWRFRRQFQPERGRCFTRRDVRKLALLRRLRDVGVPLASARRGVDAASTLDTWADWLLLVTPSGARVISEDDWARVMTTAGRAAEPVTVIRLGPIEDLTAEVTSGMNPAAVRRDAAPGAGSPPAARGDGAAA